MQAREITARENTRTQAAPVDLEHGRFEPGQVVTLWVIAVAALGAGSFGGLLLSWGLAGTESSWGWLAGLAGWLAIFGALLMGLSYAVAVAIAVLASRGWWRHQERVDDWHYAQLAAYEAAGGQQVEREVSIRSLSLSEPLHVYGVVLHVLEQAARGERAPWSSTALRGDIWYGRAKFGSLSKPEAEQFSQALAQLGLVRGRGKGAAGQLVTADLAEALQLVAQNYTKLQPGAIVRPNTGGEDEN